MVHTVFQRIAATAFGLIALTGAAAAQNYDGQGIVKFGAFSAGTWMDGTTDSALRPGGEMAGGGFGVSGGSDGALRLSAKFSGATGSFG